jgi:NADH-quinone oxidoreductase subunit G
MIVETRDNVVVRLRPRPNEQVNSYFMCDYGRLNYRWMNRQDRVDTPLIRHGATLHPVDWELALSEAVRVTTGKKTFVLASPMLSNEALFLLSELAKRTNGSGAFRVEQGEEAPLPGVEDLSLRKDRAANVKGAELLGFKRSTSPLAQLGAGDVLIVADEELAGIDAADVAKAGAIIVIGTTLPPWAKHAAAVVLPIANFAEEEGTFTNLRGRVQRFMQAKAAPGFARPSWYVLSDLLAGMGAGTNYSLASDVFKQLASVRSEFAGMSYDALGLKGAALAGSGAATAGAST